MTFKELISNIPEGKKRAYLGQIFVDAITQFYNTNGNIELEIDDLICENIDLVINNKEFINDCVNFSEEQLLQLLHENNVSDKSTIKTKRDFLLAHYTDISTDNNNYTSKPTEIVNCLIPLHDFQERIRRKVINLIFNGQKRFLIHMPTGSGKTRTAAEIMLDFLRLSSSRALLSQKIKILWIAQSSELCQQSAETLQYIVENKGTQNIHFGHFYENNELNQEILGESAIIFCSIQKLLLHFESTIWQQIRNETYLIVVDEAHRSIATQWKRALDFFVSNQSVYLLGLTATPGIGNSDNDSNYLLSTYYQNNKISITDKNYIEIPNPINYLVERKFLANIVRFDIDSKCSIESSEYDLNHSEFNFPKTTLEKLSKIPVRNSSIVNIIKHYVNSGKKILVFTCGVEHNRILKFILKEQNIHSAAIDANTKNRNQLIREFKHGNLNIILNFGVLTTGFDAPKTDICIIARPISSVVMYSQMVGRILRGPLNKGNEQNTLFTIKDNLNHGDYDQLFRTFNNFYS
jgi:DNA repair protein RadD